MEPERVSIKGKQIVILGHRGAGKSTLVQKILNEIPNHLVYDFCREHDGFNRYLPEYRRGSEGVAELDGVLSRSVLDNSADRRPGLVVIEEANRVVPNQGAIPEAVGELIDLGRHYERPNGTGVGVAYVARRPSQIDTDVIELADYLAVYRVRGSRDRKRLREERDGLGEAASNLGEYEWLLVKPDREWSVMEPVPVGDTTGRL